MSNCYCGDVYCRGGCKKADPFEAIKPSPHRPDLRLEEPMSDTPLKGHEHFCPACRKIYSCEQGYVQDGRWQESCHKNRYLPCSKECAESMFAIEGWLRKRGMG